MSIAVVIALHNGAAWIGETLASVMAQELAPAEVVVVDDGSTDAGPDIVRGFDGVRLLAGPDGTGRGSLAARNLGASETRSELLAFLDHDDVWHPSHLRLLTEALRADADAALAFSRVGVFDAETPPRFQLRDARPAPHDPYVAYPWGTGIATPSATLVRRADFEAVGGWDESVGCVGDVDLVWRLAARRRCVVSEVRTVGKRVHPRAMSVSLRRELGHLKYLRPIARRALELRRTGGADAAEQARLERRWRVFDPLAEVIRSVALREMADLAERAAALEAALRDEPEAYLDRVVHFLLYSLSLECDVGRQRDAEAELLRGLLAHWPSNAPRTRAALVRRPWPLRVCMKSVIPGFGLAWQELAYTLRERWRRRQARQRAGRLR